MQEQELSSPHSSAGWRIPPARPVCCPRRRAAAGLTLVELLIAMFIFLVGILGLMSMFPVAMNTASMAMGQVRGNILAHSALAQLSADCSVPYETGQATGGSDTTLVRPAASPRIGYYVTLTGGPGAGQSRLITSDDGTNIGVAPNNWTVVPAEDDQYIITRMGLPDPPLPGNYREFGLNRDLIVRQMQAPNIIYAGVPVAYSATANVNPLLGINGTATDASNASDGRTGILEHLGQFGADYTNHYVRLTGDPGAGQVRLVLSNDPNELTVSPAWDASDMPDVGTAYEVGWIADDTWVSEEASGTATDGGNPNPPLVPDPYLEDTTASWANDEHEGRYVEITSDPGRGQIRGITRNTDNVLYVSPEWDTVPNTSGYRIISSHGYVVITSGKAAGRILPIIWDEKDSTNGHKITCFEADWDEYGVTAAKRGTILDPPITYKLQDGTSFTVIGNSTPGLLNTLPEAGEPPPPTNPRPSPLPINYSPFPLTVNRLNVLGAENRTARDLFGKGKWIEAADGTGTAENGTTTSLTDTDKSWQANVFTGDYVELISGTGNGQIRAITGNSSDQLYVLPAWHTVPDDGTTAYRIRINRANEGSVYGYVAIFSDEGILAGHPVRVDVLVFRNLDPSEALGRNRKPVGFLTGHIRRP